MKTGFNTNGAGEGNQKIRKKRAAWKRAYLEDKKTKRSTDPLQVTTKGKGRKIKREKEDEEEKERDRKGVVGTQRKDERERKTRVP